MEEVKDELQKFLETEPKEVGFISPGHGLKGKQYPLVDDDDLVTLYTQYKKKLDIMLCCNAVLPENSFSEDKTLTSRKRKHPDAEVSKVNPSSGCSVKEVVEKLKEKHGSKFTIEKINAWAHVIDLGKHSSYDEPPDLPYFGRKKTKKNSSCIGPAQVITSPEPCAPSSPGKCIRYRSECMDQLSKWHSLLGSGISTRNCKALFSQILPIYDYLLFPMLLVMFITQQ